MAENNEEQLENQEQSQSNEEQASQAQEDAQAAEEQKTVQTEESNEENDSENLKHGEALTDDEDEEHDDEEHEEDEHEEEIEILDFSEMRKQELVAFLDDVIKKDQIKKQSENVKNARARYNELFEKDRKKALEEFLAVEGNVEMDFQYPLQLADRQWRELYRTYAGRKKAMRQAIIKEREDNLSKKNEIIEKIKELTEKATERDAFNQLMELQKQWKSIGQVPIADADNLYKTYRFINDKFFKERELIKEFLDLDKKKNLEEKAEIIKQINALAESAENLKQMMNEVKSLQEHWKDTGPVPKENLDEMMTAYRAANEKITQKKDQFIETLDKERQENLKLKEALIDKILDLTDDENGLTWIKRNHQLSEFIGAWKKVGPVPKSENERIRTQFRDAVKVFNKLKNTFFKEQKREKTANKDLKEDAIAKVQAILDAGGDLHSKRSDVIKIQKYWKTIGPTQRKDSEALWQKFRSTCDEFFNRLKEGDVEKQEEQQEHLKQKEAVCEKLEELAKKEDASVDDIKPLEEEFKSIGFVPFKEKKNIEKRFKNAVKSVVSKNMAHKEVPKELDDYKSKLEELLSKDNAAQLLDREKQNISKKIGAQKAELDTLETNIQFFSNSKGADKLIGGVKTQIEEIKSKIEKLKQEEKLLRQSYDLLR